MANSSPRQPPQHSPSVPGASGREIGEPDDQAGRTDRIRKRAFELWEQEGMPEGRQEEHWQQAERELSQKTDPSANTKDFSK